MPPRRPCSSCRCTLRLLRRPRRSSLFRRQPSPKGSLTKAKPLSTGARVGGGGAARPLPFGRVTGRHGGERQARQRADGRPANAHGVGRDAPAHYSPFATVSYRLKVVRHTGILRAVIG